MDAVDERIRFPSVTEPVRWVYASWLFGTGALTLYAARYGLEVGDGPDADFMHAVLATGYLFAWVGVFKLVTGTLLFFRRTTPLGIIAAVPYSVNILFWVTFTATNYFWLGLSDFLANMYLVYAYSYRYESLLLDPTGE